MVHTLPDFSDLKEEDITGLLELDPSIALANVRAKIAEFESKHKMTTAQMSKQYRMNDGVVMEQWMKDWRTLVVMERDLLENAHPER